MTSDSRASMVRSAASLIRSRGLSATSFSDVLVDSGAWRIIRRRQTTDDMLSLETDD